MTDVTIIVGSESDFPALEPLKEKLNELKIGYSVNVISAHRNLPELMEFVKTNKTKIYITAAGLSAALPGVVASLVEQPVIGVPIVVGALAGMDALMSILQLPKGIPCATMGIGKQGMINAALLADRMLKINSK